METGDNKIEDVRNLPRRKKQNEAIKDGIITDIKNLFHVILEMFFMFFFSLEIFDHVHLLYYNCHKIKALNANRYGSYIDYPNWIKHKKAAINSHRKFA